MRSFKPEELRQLGARDKQSDAALEPDEHTLRDEVYDHPRLSKRSIGQPSGHKVGRERNTRDQIGAQPFGLVSAQPVNRWNYVTPSAACRRWRLVACRL